MLEKLKKWLKSEKNSKDIFDIVVYGSSVRGKDKPNDIDIAVIFREGTLKRRLERIQDIKKRINTNEKIDIKGILLEELFDESLFGRSGIFLEGISILTGKQFSKRIGFVSNVIFIYSLKDKKHNEKVKFNYILSGRNGKGAIERLGGKHLSYGVISMPVINSAEFESILETNKVNYSKVEILFK